MRPRRRRPAHRSVRPRYGRVVAAVSAVGTTMTAILGAAGALPGMRESAAIANFTPPGSTVGSTAGWGASGLQLAGSMGHQVLPAPSDALPPGSGTGKRVVFDMSAQRVWLVGAAGRVQRTYLVSGSLTDNLKPGTYEVYSTSRHAIGVDDSGTMEYMVRFAHGDQAAIGFHDIPVSNGRLVQTREQLGSPQSHGCIRQWRPDAKALWRFAKVGTAVVVVP